jgi:hypothetical protein
MMPLLATLVLSLIIFAVILLVLLWARRPYYRVQRHNVVTLLRMVLSGQATENDWQVFAATPLRHDPYLHELRERCIEIEEREYIGESQSGFLFSPRGLEELQQILDELLSAGANPE